MLTIMKKLALSALYLYQEESLPPLASLPIASFIVPLSFYLDELLHIDTLCVFSCHSLYYQSFYQMLLQNFIEAVQLLADKACTLYTPPLFEIHFNVYNLIMTTACLVDFIFKDEVYHDFDRFKFFYYRTILQFLPTLADTIAMTQITALMELAPTETAPSFIHFFFSLVASLPPTIATQDISHCLRMYQRLESLMTLPSIMPSSDIPIKVSILQLSLKSAQEYYQILGDLGSDKESILFISLFFKLATSFQESPATFMPNVPAISKAESARHFLILFEAKIRGFMSSAAQNTQSSYKT
jgi:hypothetical protein